MADTPSKNTRGGKEEETKSELIFFFKYGRKNLRKRN